jgi:predicted anti-sigma-YlaC factor YlaD
MNCGLATEFVSALCDGERIPREAAEHISECGACRVKLSAYSEIGAQ